MNIGIDLDEVVVEYVSHFLEFYNESTGNDFSIEDIYCYKIQECLGIPLEEMIKLSRILNESGLVERQKFLPGARESIKELAKDNKIIFVTARPIYLREGTRNFLIKNFEGVDFEVIFSKDYNGENVPKSSVCKDRGISVFIEDRKKYALDIAGEGIRVLLFDKPWNKESEHENMIRVDSWSNVLEEVGKFSKV